MQNRLCTIHWCTLVMLTGGMLTAMGLMGCAGIGGYSNRSLYPDDLHSVYLEMFDNRSFRREVEYTLSDALAKRIEAMTPYKIVSSQDRADSVMSGQLLSIEESSLVTERELARPLEKEVVLTAVVNWKNLNTGQLMINRRTVTAAASYSDFQNQDFTYASALAANKLAQKIVELMETDW
ncbi:MAG: LPS assembly lipoprotein LptE [Sedimentisphaerales bacterium]|nr:LPS assembly lipoprotein LptE [Planctomycetota bacterium]MDY0357277.1 LPS assembly lipoprotein LptE [Sedimentisphaerales bacterium]NLT76881.1 LptE family protein [Planctomycetota bacterium]